MTNLTTPDDRTPPQKASAATLAEHSDARWADWQRRGTERADTQRRRTWTIGSIIAVGLIAWLLFTLA